MDDRDPMGIADYCKYVMGIYDFQLTRKCLVKLICLKIEIEGVWRYMRKRNSLDTLVA